MDKLTIRFLLALGLVNALVACSTPSVYYPPPPSRAESIPQAAPQSDSGEVVLALLERSQQQNQAGEVSRSIALLERALRIAPKDARLWLELARRHLEQGRRNLAQQFARKALLLGQSEPDILTAAQDLISSTLPETLPESKPARG